MSKHKTLTAVFIALSLYSCKKELETVSETSTADSITVVRDTAAVQDSITVEVQGLETFAIPAEVEGCSCYFAANKAAFENEQFLYVDDYGNSAYLKMNGKQIKIPMDEGDFDPSNFSKTIENADYKVTMTGRKLSELEETMMFAGEMTVESRKTGEKITTPIYGECGC